MAQLSWNDIFDFSSLDDPSPSSPPAFDPTLHDKCSDFACCGLSLPDLHALVDHFEENHVLIVGHNGQLSSSPLVVSYPQPDPPAECSTLLGFSPYTRAHGHLHPRADLFDHDFSDATSSDTASHSSGSTFPSPNPSEPICLPPSLFSVYPPLPPDVLPECAPLERTRERQSATKPAPAPARAKASKAKAQLLHPHPQPHLPPAETQRKRRSREREKAYKCPRPGCSKAYLNPNGLKYHLEKGTCTIVMQADSGAETPA
ncbi:hypothetical protein FOMPIDRAFT_1057253 [Fomitopsis schrenkii]|uniref:C2H2-type domain-containing protein n=1 Tax=Fomitopsis schrenkii TaxID=2126942 RepID=S8G5K7_FOMSC|nr:hypothetical protein FOMPIDRAFT_1057253 [Fomitopsis schrenkii]